MVCSFKQMIIYARTRDRHPSFPRKNVYLNNKETNAMAQPFSVFRDPALARFDLPERALLIRLRFCGHLLNNAYYSLKQCRSRHSFAKRLCELWVGPGSLSGPGKTDAQFDPVFAKGLWRVFTTRPRREVTLMILPRSAAMVCNGWLGRTATTTRKDSMRQLTGRCRVQRI
jgi:hypothetical protein